MRSNDPRRVEAYCTGLASAYKNQTAVFIRGRQAAPGNTLHKANPAGLLKLIARDALRQRIEAGDPIPDQDILRWSYAQPDHVCPGRGCHHVGCENRNYQQGAGL